MDFSLPRKEIIRSKKDIEALLAKGRVLFRHPVKAYWIHREDGEESRIMVSVPKRNFKRAVRRNRLKRLMREAFRLNRNMLARPDCDFLFVYLGKEMCDYATVESRIREIFAIVGDETEKGGSMAPDNAG